MCVLCPQTGDLLSGLVGWDVCLVFSDRRPAFGSCRLGCVSCVLRPRPAFESGMCVLFSQTGDLLSSLVGWDVCLVFSDRRPAFGSCRLGCVSCVLRLVTCFRVL